jgi:hypothetical protein
MATLWTSSTKSGRACQDLALRESELKQKAKDTADATMRLDMFRNYLAENDIVLNNDGQQVETESETASRVAELETSTRACKNRPNVICRLCRAKSKTHSHRSAQRRPSSIASAVRRVLP